MNLEEEWTNTEFQLTVRKYKEEPVRAEEYTNWMKNILESINSRQDNTEGQISDLEDGVADITQAKQEKRQKRILKNNDSLRDFRDNIKCTHFHVIGAPEGENWEKGGATSLRKY